MGSRGYLTDIGLVPLASDKYKVTRTAAKDLVTINPVSYTHLTLPTSDLV